MCIVCALDLHRISVEFASNFLRRCFHFAIICAWTLHWICIELALFFHWRCIEFAEGDFWGESEFPSTGEEIQNCWHSIRSHSQSWDNMAKHWGVDFDRYCNLGSGPARRAGPASRLQILSKSAPQCLDIWSQLWLWLLIVCQQCWILSPVLGNSDERPNA